MTPRELWLAKYQKTEADVEKDEFGEFICVDIGYFTGRSKRCEEKVYLPEYLSESK